MHRSVHCVTFRWCTSMFDDSCYMIWQFNDIRFLCHYYVPIKIMLSWLCRENVGHLTLIWQQNLLDMWELLVIRMYRSVNINNKIPLLIPLFQMGRRYHWPACPTGDAFVIQIPTSSLTLPRREVVGHNIYSCIICIHGYCNCTHLSVKYTILILYYSIIIIHP